MALVHCTKCGHQMSTTAVRCPSCGASPSSTLSPQAIQTVSRKSSPSPTQNSSLDTIGLKKRYQDAYRIAKTIVGFGSLIKFVALVGGLIAFSIGLRAVGSAPSGFIGASLFAFFVAGSIYVIAVVVSARGQLLQATLDTAVNTSPFLRESDRAEIMSLT
jgi:zinc-ribbon domain